MSASALIIKQLEEILGDLCKIADKENLFQYPNTNGEIILFLTDEINKITKYLLRRKIRMS